MTADELLESWLDWRGRMELLFVEVNRPTFDLMHLAFVARIHAKMATRRRERERGTKPEGA